MKEKIIYTLFLCFLFATSNEIHAQITIGSDIPPNKGTLLDLKEHAPNAQNITATKGLLMPRVELKSENSLEGIATGITSNEEKKKHTGLVVYSTTSTSQKTCPGLFVWNGDKWTPLYPYSYETCPITFDTEGNAYHYKKYGNLYWFTSNLRSIMKSKTEPIDTNNIYANIENRNVAITSSTDLNQKVNYTENGQSVSLSLSDFATKFGFLYTLNQAIKACPEDWRPPTYQEWINLANLFGGTDIAGKKLKSNNTSINGLNWNTDAAPDGSDNSGLNILPAGIITAPSADLKPYFFGSGAYLRASDIGLIIFDYNSSKVDSFKDSGLDDVYLSVRCVKDVN